MLSGPIRFELKLGMIPALPVQERPDSAALFRNDDFLEHGTQEIRSLISMELAG
jgi:hypothetical protein